MFLKSIRQPELLPDCCVLEVLVVFLLKPQPGSAPRVGKLELLLVSPQLCKCSLWWGDCSIDILVWCRSNTCSCLPLSSGHLHPDFVTAAKMATLMGIGGAAGKYIGDRVEPTSLPQTVAAFHSRELAWCHLYLLCLFQSHQCVSLSLKSCWYCGICCRYWWFF